MHLGSRAAPAWVCVVAAVGLAACSYVKAPKEAQPPTVAPIPKAEKFAGLVRPWPIPEGGGERPEPADPARSLVTRAFARLSVGPEILRYRKDYLPVDRFRLSLVDRGINDPAGILRPGDPLAAVVFPDPSLEGAEWLIEWAAARLDPYAASLGRRRGELPLSIPEGYGELTRLPPAIATALDPLIDTATGAAQKVAEAFAAIPPEDRARLRRILMKGVLDLSSDSGDLDELTAYWDRVDLGALVQAALLGLRALEATRDAIARLPRGSLPMTQDPDGILARIETPAGLIRIGGPGPSLHQGPALLSIDLGGDDIYDDVCSSEPTSLCLVLDLGGNDFYRAEKSPGPGGGLLGVGVALDSDGDDTYEGSSVAFGSGALGVGVLIDEDGDDRYSADRQAEGAGFFGIGLLLDRSGNDHYAATFLAQGVGTVAGIGMLVDEKGDDLYEAGYHIADGREQEGAWLSVAQGYGFGARGWASGGIGLLWDRAGNDRYVASYFAQGGAYWYGLGLLLDESGNDIYLARRYAQGAGVHASVGILRDGAGNDSYLSWGVSQGCGHDLAVGILLDEKGNDTYAAHWLSQGAGNENGLGMLVDLRGDDRYAGSGGDLQGWGTSSPEREAVSFGLLLDGGGNDAYSAGGRNDESWVKGSVGVGVDAPDASLF